jgi:hypothetical protein
MSKYKDKRGQIGETITWIIATVVIIGVLIFFIYLSVLISKTKIIQTLNLQLDVSEKSELLTQKNLFSYQLTNDLNKEMIENILKENNP